MHYESIQYMYELNQYPYNSVSWSDANSAVRVRDRSQISILFIEKIFIRLGRGGGGGLGPVRLVFEKKKSNSIYGWALFAHVIYDLHKVKVNLANISMAMLCDHGNVNLGVW